jgi:hypothetical protein
MSDPARSSPATPDSKPAQPQPDQEAPSNLAPHRRPITKFHIGEEFGTAKRNLPPAGIVLICIAAVAVIVGIFAFTERPKPQGAGSIDFVTAADVPGQDMILAAITVTLRNTARGRYGFTLSRRSSPPPMTKFSTMKPRPRWILIAITRRSRL